MTDSWPAHRGHAYFPGQFWDHYTEHPDIYDRFAMSTDAGVAFLAGLPDLGGRSVLDIASGTGRSAFAIARSGKSVLGVEPDARMRSFAEARRSQIALSNVRFIEGSTHALPHLEEAPFDLVTSFHGPPWFEHEIEPYVAAVRPLVLKGGTIVIQTAIPGWQHEYHAALPPGPVADRERAMERVFLGLGFHCEDAMLAADYGTPEEALATYGFIYGPHAIDWLLDGSRSTVPWGIRTYLLTI